MGLMTVNHIPLSDQWHINNQCLLKDKDIKYNKRIDMWDNVPCLKQETAHAVMIVLHVLYVEI